MNFFLLQRHTIEDILYKLTKFQRRLRWGHPPPLILNNNFFFEILFQSFMSMLISFNKNQIHWKSIKSNGVCIKNGVNEMIIVEECH
jgi:uracil DNA glycosylase